jgi:hypothetical protein
MLVPCLNVLLCVREGGGNTFLRNVDKRLPDYTAAHPKREFCVSHEIRFPSVVDTTLLIPGAETRLRAG